MNTVIVQLDEHQWTMQAMHLACAMARSTQSTVTLLHLMPVHNIGLLGTPLGISAPSVEEQNLIATCREIAEDYGVEAELLPMQYYTLYDALAQATDYVDAYALFANLTKNPLNLWRKYRLWSLHQQLAAVGCKLYTLDQPTNTKDWVPSVSLRASK